MFLKNLLDIFKKKEADSSVQKPILSERSEIIKRFVDRLNAERLQSGRKTLPAAFYAIKMAESGLTSNSDLYWFLRYCEDSKNFSACWWYSLKAKQ